MDVNIFKSAALCCLVASLFLPWFSYHIACSVAVPNENSTATYIMTYNAAPLSAQGTGASLVLYDGELMHHDSVFYHGDDFVRGILCAIHPYYLVLALSDGYPGGVRMVSLSLLYCAYVFAACFAVAGSVLASVWTDARRRLFLVSLGMLVAGMVLYLIVTSVWIGNTLGVHQRPPSAGPTGTAIYDAAVILNTGFYAALAGAALLALSHAHPKSVRVPIPLRLPSRFKEMWLAVPDSEKLPVAFLTALLLSWLFSSLVAFLF